MFVAAHVPLVVSKNLERATYERNENVVHTNPFHEAVPGAGRHCVAVFRDPDADISPSPYSTKHVHGEVVPTWAYLEAEVRGFLNLKTDPKAMLAYFEPATRDMEAASPTPWSIDDAPIDNIYWLECGFIGLNLRVSIVTAKRKINQDKSLADDLSVLAGYAASSQTSHQLLFLETPKESQKP
ncbi:FMN-binding negative transcriptional regulator [Candidatus Phycosocius spiralis]|uniref:Transcriptional regulator n=1 Tax=Candidatus Phycosocius spiralis TaxID=2815099 RepID=A0ABQ4PWJ6_9PROT|nr:FMN-binding negative transcriptional regulator [Candidatus Phycosocius spiralis]GIU67321.1 transcriptional regulator [Candidatus Phycosocius spiralis]